MSAKSSMNIIGNSAKMLTNGRVIALVFKQSGWFLCAKYKSVSLQYKHRELEPELQGNYQGEGVSVYAAICGTRTRDKQCTFKQVLIR